MVHNEYNQRVSEITFRASVIATFTTDCESFAEARSECRRVRDSHERWGRARIPLHSFENRTSLVPARPNSEHQQHRHICLQHELGIFGGVAGATSKLRRTQHAHRRPPFTVLKAAPAQRQVMDESTALSDRMVVMSERDTFLRIIYGFLKSESTSFTTVFRRRLRKFDYFMTIGKLVLLFRLLSPTRHRIRHRGAAEDPNGFRTWFTSFSARPIRI